MMPDAHRLTVVIIGNCPGGEGKWTWDWVGVVAALLDWEGGELSNHQ